MQPVFAPIRDKVERAARNGERLHLSVEEVRAFIVSPLYARLAELTAEEFASQWEKSQPVPSLVPTGFGIEPSAPSGSFAGTMSPVLKAAVERADEQRASEVEMQAPRRRRR